MSWVAFTREDRALSRVAIRQMWKGSMRRSGPPLVPALVVLLATLPGTVSPASAQVLVDDTEFQDWETMGRLAEWMVSGRRQASGGNPGAFWEVVHTHRNTDPFSPQVVSDSFLTGVTIDPSSLDPERLLVFQVDLRATEVGSHPAFLTEVEWQPRLRQGANSSSLSDPFTPFTLGGGFARQVSVTTLDSFRPAIDRGPGAPPVELGLTLVTRKLVAGLAAQDVTVSIDNFEVIAADPQPVVITLDDGGHRWMDDPVIPYEVTVSNRGPALRGVTVLETVPVRTRFVAERSTPGWECVPGAGEGSHCELDVGPMGSDEERTVAFAVRVEDGTPEGFEVWNEVGFALPGEALTATNKAVRCEVSHAWRVGQEQHCDQRDGAFFFQSLPSSSECALSSYTPFGLSCCFQSFLLQDCDKTCMLACPVPCS